MRGEGEAASGKWARCLLAHSRVAMRRRASLYSGLCRCGPRLARSVPTRGGLVRSRPATSTARPSACEARAGASSSELALPARGSIAARRARRSVSSNRDSSRRLSRHRNARSARLLRRRPRSWRAARRRHSPRTPALGPVRCRKGQRGEQRKRVTTRPGRALVVVTVTTSAAPVDPSGTRWTRATSLLTLAGRSSRLAGVRRARRRGP